MTPKLAKAIFHIGANYRNPSLWEEYDKLKESEWMNLSELCNLQIKRARDFFIFVNKHSEYYKKIFKEVDFNPHNFSCIPDIEIIPPVSKTQLISDNEALHTDYKFEKIIIAETSGTSGSALEFKKNERWDSINRATMMRAYDWYDVKPWDKSGYLWGYNIEQKQALKVRFFDYMQNQYRTFNYDKASIKKFASYLGSATYVAGYSSMIFESAKLINEMELKKPSLKLVKGTSEMILDAYQSDAIKAFGRKIVSEYGAAEAGLIAFECPEGNMHINIENVIVEIDAEGDILITNLSSYSFPIIRYKLGDSVTLSEESCKCGRAHPVIKEIAGRKGSVVVGMNSKYPALTFYYVFKNLAIQNSVFLNYKAVQTESGAVDLFLEGTKNSQYETVIMDELTKYFNNDIIFTLKFVKNFSRQAKKTQYFESRL